jgi:serine/threonine protein kinase
MFCSSCGAKNAPEGRFCSACGAALNPDVEATFLGSDPVAEGATIDSPTPRRPAPPQTPAPRTPRAPSASAGTTSSSDSIAGGRFVPGQIVAGRYRIVALAGRGGMGEVYRAEDLRLSQIVAIKFLPESLSKDAAALARFHSEVRIARQVSHPNVCRMFDIGDVDGIAFLTMEYVDGEDLSSLVRRIGRLSADKATEIARQTCAGLAAAHDRGVIHRDLKPANLMLDSAGKIRITDFGLAAIAASIQGAEVRAGTPAYMAPEQLAGKEVTIKSDLYSLGLVLYEILTGKRAFEAVTLPELMKLREESAPTSPSTLVRDLDPLLERVILRCLEKDRAMRPSSALQVAAALPGGDPLAAALAAGETPSPQMVAAAGETGGFASRVALSLLAAVVLGSILFVYIGVKENGLERLHPKKSPDVLVNKAGEILAKLGYPETPADRAHGFGYDTDFVDYVEKNDKPKPDWNKVMFQRPQELVFWYRQSPSLLVAKDIGPGGFVPGFVTFDDPPPIQSGMITMWMDSEGRLQWLQVIPQEKNSSDGKTATPSTPPPSIDWAPLFAAAELDMTRFHAAPSTWTSLAESDTHQAWDGVWPGSGRPLHVEAAALLGRPVYFGLYGSWTKPTRTAAEDRGRGAKATSLIVIIMGVLLFIGTIWFAMRNIARKRGDRKGAWRLACVVFAIQILTFVLQVHFVASSEMFFLLVMAMSTALFASGLTWLVYMALEPYIRKNWPQAIISWTRLTSGALRDPLVGRDVVIGILLGMSWVLVIEAGIFFDIRDGSSYQLAGNSYLLGAREAAGNLLVVAVSSILGTFEFFLELVFIRVVVRNRWIAAVVFVVLLTLLKVLVSDHLLIETIMWATVFAIAAFAVVRFGLVALGVAVFMANTMLNLPYSLDFSNWYAAHCLFIVLIFVALGTWGFYLSLAGKPLWRDELLD